MKNSFTPEMAMSCPPLPFDYTPFSAKQNLFLLVITITFCYPPICLPTMDAKQVEKLFFICKEFSFSEAQTFEHSCEFTPESESPMTQQTVFRFLYNSVDMLFVLNGDTCSLVWCEEQHIGDCILK